VELDYYFFKSRRLQKEFAKSIGIGAHTISAIINKHKTPSLYTALAIHFESEGKVSLFSLLKDAEKEKLNKKYGILKKENVYNGGSCAEGKEGPL